MSSNNNDGGPVDEAHGQPDIVGTSNNESSYTSQHSIEEEPDSHLMQGYTPLSFNMNDMIDINDDDDEGETDDGEEFANNGYYHIMGVGGSASPKRINGIKDHALGYSMGRHDDSDNNEHDSDSSFGIQHQNTTDDATNLDVPVDFLSLAEQALRGLEEDHRATLELSASHNTEIHDTNTASIPGAKEIDTNSDVSPLTITNKDQLNEEEEALTIDFAKMFPPLEETASETVPITSNVDINVNAVQKAMNSIRLKSPQLANTLDAGALSSFSSSSTALQTSFKSVIDFTMKSIQSIENQTLSSHAVIPNGPLAAFRRSTPKAKSASANLSRSATLSEAVLRLWPLISFRRRIRAIGAGEQKMHHKEKHSKTLIIHILGCDHVECSSEEVFRKSFGPFARWLSAALQSGVLVAHTSSADTSQSVIDSLMIEVSGPNVPDWILDRKINLLPTSTPGLGGLVSATATFNQQEYHEQSRDDTADMAIAYNAGIWGYDSWKPTLSFMCQSEDYNSYACIPFVVTAYTIEECEDDAEVIAEIAEEAAVNRMELSENQGGVLAHQIWAPEPNQFSSRVERETASVPRQYFENGAWQAWLLGPLTLTT